MNCNFCGHGIERGTESIYVTQRGKALYFCSSKCGKNMLKLKRKQMRVKWTDKYREEKSIRIKGITTSEKGEEKTIEKTEEEVEKKPRKKKRKKEVKNENPDNNKA